MTPARRPATEPLEPRRLLTGLTGGEVGDAEVDGITFALAVNFQQGGSVPGGFVADLGRPLVTDQIGDFGWNAEQGTAHRTRLTPAAKKFDTFAHTQDPINPDAVWEIVVPDGLYRVAAIAGDPEFADSDYDFLAEGRPLLRGTPTDASPFVGGETLVYVRDRRLTISNGPAAVNNKLSHVVFERLRGLPDAGAPVRVNFAADAAAKVDGFLTDAGATYGLRRNGLTYGWDAPNDLQVDRGLLADQRLDTFTHIQAGGGSVWDIAVEPGTYEVYVVAGDAKLTNSVYDVTVEGLPVAVGTPGGGRQFVDGRALVGVTDGRLTVGSGSSAVNNKLAYVELRRVAARSSGVASPARDATWTQVASTPTPVYESQAVVLGDEIISFGGFVDGTRYRATLEAFAYDVPANTYTRVADLPEQITHAQPLVIGGEGGDEVWLIGGFVGDLTGPATDSVWIYNRDRNTYRRGPTLPFANGAGGAVYDGRYIHYMGGQERDPATGTSTGAVLGHHLFYDTTRPRLGWMRARDMPEANSHFGMVLVGRNAYLIGGMESDDEWGGNRASMWRYNLDQARWFRQPDIPEKLSHINESTFFDGETIYVVGGAFEETRPLNNASDRVYGFSFETGTWTRLLDIPGGGRKNPVARLVAGRLFVGGGGTVFAPKSSAFVVRLDGTWQGGATMPAALGEAAGGVVGDLLVVTGDGDDRTLAYDLIDGEWSTRSQRPVVGKDQLAHSIGGKLYLFGGVSYRSGGQVVQDAVQVYDPATDAWELKRPMPYASLAAQSAVAGDYVYLFGGVVEGNVTTDRAVRYHVPSDTWEELGPMPVARDSGASGYDGRRYVWIFGGRDGGDAPGDGYDDTLAYDTKNGVWYTSAEHGLARLPQRRGGISNAPFVDGRFYVIGGETGDDLATTGPAGTYARVDVYDPLANRWSRAPDLPTARHGVGPVYHAGRVYVFGGGTVRGESRSDLLEILNLL